MAKAEGAAAVAEGNQSGCGWPGIVVQIHLISPTEDAAQEAKIAACGNGSPATPRACTSETQKLLEVLAATLRSLSDEDRARLAELIQRED